MKEQDKQSSTQVACCIRPVNNTDTKKFTKVQCDCVRILSVSSLKLKLSISSEHIYVLTLCLSISFFMSQLFYSHRHTCKVKFCTALKLIVKWIMDELTN